MPSQDVSLSGSDAATDTGRSAPVILTSFTPILEQISGSIVVQDNEYRLIADPSDDDWKRLQAHAAIIEELSISDLEANHAYITDAVYFRLGQLQGTSNPLMPKLRQLRIFCEASTSLLHLFLFFSPSLEHVEIVGLPHVARTTLKAFLDFGARQMHLTTLILDPINITADVVKLITQCASMKSLGLRNVKENWDAYLLNELALLPQLQYFTIDATNIQGTYPGDRCPDGLTKDLGRFCSLRSLHFQGDADTFDKVMSDRQNMPSLEIVHLVLRGCQEELSLSRRPPVQGTLIRKILQCLIGVHKSLPSDQMVLAQRITSLSIAFSDGPKGFPKDYFKILSDLSNLELLQIKGVSYVEALGEGLLCVIPKWPKMQTLCFPISAIFPVFISTVAAIARNCPHLKTLQIPVNPAKIGAPVALQDVISCPLRTLSVGGPSCHEWSSPSGRMESLNYTARWLYALFPDLESVETHKGFQDEFWSDVGRLIKLCQDAAKFTRRRDAGCSLEDGTV